MKSKLFRDTARVPKECAEDFKIVAKLNLSEDVRKTIAHSIGEYLLAPTGKTEVNAIDTLRKKLALPLTEMNPLISVSLFFLRNLEPDDPVEDIMTDLKDMAIIGEKEVAPIRLLLESLKRENEQAFAIERVTVGTQHAVLKNLTGMSHVVDLRAVVPNELDIDDDVKEYSPIIEKLVPTGIIRLRLTGDESFRFQLDFFTLKTLQDELKAMEKEIQAVINYVGIDKVHLGQK